MSLLTGASLLGRGPVCFSVAAGIEPTPQNYVEVLERKTMNAELLKEIPCDESRGISTGTDSVSESERTR